MNLSTWLNPNTLTNFKAIVSKTGSSSTNSPAPFDTYITGSGAISILRGNATVNDSVATGAIITASSFQYLSINSTVDEISTYYDGAFSSNGSISTTIADDDADLHSNHY